MHRSSTRFPQAVSAASGPLTLDDPDTTLRSPSHVMTLPRPTRGTRPAVAAASASWWRRRWRPDEPPLFRLFLRDGAVVACLGEYARVDTHVVCSLAIDGAEATELVSLALPTRVDWVRTEDYTVALRAARYAEARGEHDFAELSGEVARLLNEVGPDHRQRDGGWAWRSKPVVGCPNGRRVTTTIAPPTCSRFCSWSTTRSRISGRRQARSSSTWRCTPTVDAPVPAPLLAVPTPEEAVEPRRRRRRATRKAPANGCRCSRRFRPRSRGWARACRWRCATGCAMLVGRGWPRSMPSTRLTRGWQPRWRAGRRLPPRVPMCAASSVRSTSIETPRPRTGPQAPRSRRGHPGDGAGRPRLGASPSAGARPMGSQVGGLRSVPRGR